MDNPKPKSVFTDLTWDQKQRLAPPMFKEARGVRDKVAAACAQLLLLEAYAVTMGISASWMEEFIIPLHEALNKAQTVANLFVVADAASKA